MFFINLAQDPTAIPDEQVAQVIEQTTQAIDSFNNLGLFMAVLLIILVVVVLAGAIILLMSYSNRNTNQTALNALSLSHADKINEIKEAREERREAREKDETYRQQFLAALALLAGKQLDVRTGVQAAEEHIIKQVKTSEGVVGENIETSSEEAAANFEELKDLFIMTFDMYMQDPRATLDRIKRMQQALADGDRAKAQRVVNEQGTSLQAVLDAEIAVTDQQNKKPAPKAAKDTPDAELAAQIAAATAAAAAAATATVAATAAAVALTATENEAKP